MKKIFLVLSLILVSGAALASDHEGTAFFNSYAKQAFYFLAVALAAKKSLRLGKKIKLAIF